MARSTKEDKEENGFETNNHRGLFSEEKLEGSAVLDPTGEDPTNTCDRIVVAPIESSPAPVSTSTIHMASQIQQCTSTPWQKRIEDHEPYGDGNCSRCASSLPHYLETACAAGEDSDQSAPLPRLVDYLNEASTYQALEQQLAQIKEELDVTKARLVQKDLLLQSMQSTNECQATRKNSVSLYSTIEKTSSTTDSSCAGEDGHTADASANESEKAPGSATLKNFSAWLFREASCHEDLSGFIHAYLLFLIDQGIPIHGLNLMACVEPATNTNPAYFCTWTWHEEKLTQQRVTSVEVEEDPMMEFWRKASSNQRQIRVQVNAKFRDSVAMPIRHKKACKGGMAWSTNDEFSDDHIAFLEESHPALCTVLRSYWNELKAEHVDNLAKRAMDLETANRNLYEVNQRIKQQSGQQLKHFAMMSHEIRTPLNGMIGLTSLLQNSVDDLTPEQAETVEMIANSGDLLLRVVNDVLDYSKLTLGMVEIHKEVTAVIPMLDQVVNATRVKAAQRGIRLRARFARDLPLFIYTDGRRLQQIIFNLLGNAIKFSHNDSVVELKVTKNDAMAGTQHERPRLRIMVKDYGKGIEKSHFAKIFEPFRQADAETERTYGGTGLGLAITSRLVKSLGGSIKVDSEVGKWCVFTVELDLKDVDESTEEGDDDLTSENDLSSENDLTSIADLTTNKDTPTNDEGTPKVLLLSSSSIQLVQSSGLAEMRKTKRVTPARSEKTSSSSDLSRSEKTFSPFPDSKGKGGNKRTTPTTSEATLSPSTSDDSPLETLRVLIAEDNRINQTLLQRTLRRIGVKNVDIVGDGSIAVRQCKENVYDLILMDMQMPEMDGIEATRLIRQECPNSNASTKIVFVTAHALHDYEAKAREVGADGFLSKPYKFQSIKEIIDQALQEKR